MTQDNRDATKFLLLLFVIIIFIWVFLASCSSPYKIVATKANPSAKERSLLAVACEREFPPIVSQFTVDSIAHVLKQDYSKQIDSLINETEKLDSIIHEQVPIIDTTFVDSTNCLPRIQVAYSEINRLNKQRNVLQASIVNLKNELAKLKRGYVPCEEKIIYRDRTTNRCDSAAMQVLRDNAKNKADSLLVVRTQLASKKKTASTLLWILIALVAAGGLAAWLKVKKII